MDITQLPQEIFEEIGLFLNVGDILSCCLVSTSWRNSLNINRIWSRLCLTKFGLFKKDELITNENLVKPNFVTPTNNSIRLTELCQWRIRFMQEVHISKNWRNGRYVTEIITRINVGEMVESEENLIIVPNNERRLFIPWIIENDCKVLPVVPFSLENMLASFFKLNKGKVVIAQCTLLQVFSKTKENEFVLSHRFLFNKSYKDSKDIPSSPDITEWYNSTVGLYPCDISMCCDHDGKYFVGVILEGDLNLADLHIWDIITGVKILQQSLPIVNNVIIDVRFTIHNSKLVLFLKLIENDKKCTKIYCYDLNTLTYTNMVIHFDYALPLVLVGDPYILTANTSGHTFYLWRILNGEFVYKYTSENYLNPMTIQFASSFILICENAPYSDTIKIFCTKKLKTIYQFCTGFPVTNLTLIRSELMLIIGSREFGLWDIATGSKLYTINGFFLCRHVIWTNRNFSKIAVETEGNELYLFDFW